jgi:hypothetical protein
VLQVVTKKYFREGVPLHTHRTSAGALQQPARGDREAVHLPVGSLQASASLSARPFAFTATVVEHLEAKEPDGTDALLVATSGDEIIDDLAAVLSFRTNSLFSRDVGLVRRLVSSPKARERSNPGALFKDTFDGGRFLPGPEIAEIRDDRAAGPLQPAVPRTLRRLRTRGADGRARPLTCAKAARESSRAASLHDFTGIAAARSP